MKEQETYRMMPPVGSRNGAYISANLMRQMPWDPVPIDRDTIRDMCETWQEFVHAEGYLAPQLHKDYVIAYEEDGSRTFCLLEWDRVVATGGVPERVFRKKRKSSQPPRPPYGSLNIDNNTDITVVIDA